MKIESLREVKAKLSKIVKELPSERSVVITKNGRPCAVLFPVTEETDLESMLLAQRKDFWQLFDRTRKEGEKKGFTNENFLLSPMIPPVLLHRHSNFPLQTVQPQGVTLTFTSQ